MGVVVREAMSCVGTAKLVSAAVVKDCAKVDWIVAMACSRVSKLLMIASCAVTCVLRAAMMFVCFSSDWTGSVFPSCISLLRVVVAVVKREAMYVVSAVVTQLCVRFVPAGRVSNTVTRIVS